MRTTIRLNDDLFREVKSYSAKAGKSLNAFFEEAVRDRLNREMKPGKRSRLRLHTFKKGRGVQPGVDLNDNAALLDIMEGKG